MQIEIDQSGKFEQLNTHTIIACANDKNSAIRITASVKRKLVQTLRSSIVPQKDLFPIIFAVLVFVLLDSLEKYPDIVIVDEEYTGKEKTINETLTKLLHRKTKGKWKGQIRFKRVGKSSPAHQLAWRLHRLKRQTEERKIIEKDVLKLWE